MSPIKPPGSEIEKAGTQTKAKKRDKKSKKTKKSKKNKK